MPKSKEELKTELEDWECRKFENMMSDKWTFADKQFDMECDKHIRELTKQINEMED